MEKLKNLWNSGTHGKAIIVGAVCVVAFCGYCMLLFLPTLKSGSPEGDFWISFLANILSDVFLAIALYIIVTQPGEKRKNKEMVTKSLGLLKAEAQINLNRATAYGQALVKPNETIVSLFPLRYSRGAWTALKETDLFSRLDDVRLKYYLFRMNEATLVANKNLRKLQLAYLGAKEEDLGHLVSISRNEIEYVCRILNNVLMMLHSITIPDFAIEDPFEAELASCLDKD